MATAGSIVVDLLMKTGSFETDAQRASRAAQKNFKEIEKQAQSAAQGVTSAFSGLLTGALFGVGIGSAFGKFIQETKNAQNEQAQLAAVVKSTGAAAGYSVDQLNKMATALSNASVFSEGDINQAQTRLLSYTGIVGEEFPRAMQAVIDMSARMGVSVEQSAETIGKALDVPSQGLTALSKQGFRFTEDQKKLVEQLEKAGKTAEAQGIILSALESSYGGAAKAARETLGGALQALQNQIDDLMTGSDGSVNGLTGAINDLTDLLGSSETKETFNTFTSFLAEVASGLITAANEFTKAARAADSWMEAINVKVADTIFGDADPAKEVEILTKRLNENRDAVEKLRAAQAANPSGKSTNMFGFEQNENYEQRISVLQSAIKAGEARLVFANGRLAKKDNAILEGLSGVAETGGPTETLTPIRVAAGTSSSASNAGRERLDQGQKLIDQMNQRIALIGKETEYEKLLEQVRIGSVTFKTQAQQEEALASAQTLDFINEQTKAYEESKKQAEDFAKLMEDLYPEKARSDQFIAQLTQLSNALEQGWINADQFADAVDRLNQTFEKDTGEMGEFAKEAARGIQNSLGDGLYQIMQGNFKNIGTAFLQMLQKMAADALAAQIAKKLFGDFDSGGGLGGIFGALFSGISGSAGGGVGSATAADVGGAGGGLMFLADGGYTGPGGKYDVAGIVHRGEYVVNADATKRLGRGFLDRLNGFADGGYVGSDRGPAGLGAGGMNLNIETRGVDIEVVEARQNEMYLIARQVVATDTPAVMQREIANPSSRSSRQLSRSTTAERRR
jgi:lambda family phage tail tape measure protein